MSGASRLREHLDTSRCCTADVDLDALQCFCLCRRRAVCAYVADVCPRCAPECGSHIDEPLHVCRPYVVPSRCRRRRMRHTRPLRFPCAPRGTTRASRTGSSSLSRCQYSFKHYLFLFSTRLLLCLNLLASFSNIQSSFTNIITTIHPHKHHSHIHMDGKCPFCTPFARSFHRIFMAKSSLGIILFQA